jgi:pantoate--beta-alanine ligase
VEIVGAPIARDLDGLALSSRNVYLTSAQRAIAPALRRALGDAAEAMATGATVEAAEAKGLQGLIDAGFGKVDYFETRDPDSLDRLGPGPLTGPARLLCAAHLGRTRLLDNLAVQRP